VASNDASFVGSIPELYDRNVGPLMMVPYASDIARRLPDMVAGRLLKKSLRALASSLPRWLGRCRTPSLSPPT
jgi:hypothetical protein